MCPLEKKEISFQEIAIESLPKNGFFGKLKKENFVYLFEKFLGIGNNENSSFVFAFEA